MDVPVTDEAQTDQAQNVQAHPFAPGLHLLVDFWGCRGLRDTEGIERVLREAAEASGATVLNVMLHNFGESGGITGVALLAESHISIHTWPETGYAALDLFMCGRCAPREALPVLEAWFSPGSTKVTEHWRG